MACSAGAHLLNFGMHTMVKLSTYTLGLSLLLLAMPHGALALPSFLQKKDVETGVIPFYTFSQTTQFVQQNLNCKWISTVPTKGRSKLENRTYDYLCKGGTWGTVTLLVDAKTNDSLGAVKLIWRSWDPAVHPAGGEASSAALFLDFFAHYFVPEKLADDIKTNFWQPKNKKWRTNLVDIQHYYTQEDGYGLHELLVTGKGKALPQGGYQPQPAAPQHVEPPVSPPQFTPPVVRPKPQPKPVPPKLAAPKPVAENLTPAPVAPLKPAVETKPKPKPRNKIEPKLTPKPAVKVPPKPALQAPVTVPQTPETTIRWQGDVLEINGLSNGKRAINTGVFDAKEGQVFEVLRGTESFLRTQPPPLTGAYQESIGLTKSFTETVEERGDTLREEVESLILNPSQVGPILDVPSQQSIEDILNAPIPQTGLPPEEDGGRL